MVVERPTRGPRHSALRVSERHLCLENPPPSPYNHMMRTLRVGGAMYARTCVRGCSVCESGGVSHPLAPTASSVCAVGRHNMRCTLTCDSSAHASDRTLQVVADITRVLNGQ